MFMCRGSAAMRCAQFGCGLAGGGATWPWPPSPFCCSRAFSTNSNYGERDVLFGQRDDVSNDSVRGGSVFPPSRASPKMAPRGVAAPPTPSVEASTIVGAHLPPSRASPETAPRGVAVAGAPLPIDACWCAPPTITGESENGSV
jgi:hypothetical protein